MQELIKQFLKITKERVWLQLEDLEAQMQGFVEKIIDEEYDELEEEY